MEYLKIINQGLAHQIALDLNAYMAANDRSQIFEMRLFHRFYQKINNSEKSGSTVVERSKSSKTQIEEGENEDATVRDSASPTIFAFQKLLSRLWDGVSEKRPDECLMQSRQMVAGATKRNGFAGPRYLRTRETKENGLRSHLN